MTILEKLVVQDFRNIELQELTFSSNLNCISGNNGEGKTNLLDAIYYLSMTKSAFSTIDRFNFRHGKDVFSIAGLYRLSEDRHSRFSIQVSSQGEKKVKRDDKSYQKISDHIGALPVVMVSPSDSSLVSESGDERRKFINSVLSQLDREYLSLMQQYNRLLLQRNRLLKNGISEPDLLSAFDERMAILSTPIFEKRKALVADLIPVVQSYYSRVSGGKEDVSIIFRSDLSSTDSMSLFKQSLKKDMTLKYTTSGIHRDDFIFEMSGYPIRKCGSQGQQKSFLVSLKFAQYEIMKNRYGFPPVLLLDDLFDKLDMERVSNLLKMVSGNEFGQIFLTDTDKTRIKGIVDSITEDCAFFHAEGGSFTRL